MNILHVVTSLDPALGGISQGIRSSISALVEFGISSEVVCLDAPESVAQWSDSFTVHALDEAMGPWSYHTGLYVWLLNNFSRFDVVITNGLWLYPSYAVYKALKKYKNAYRNQAEPRVFVMPHGMLDPWFQHAKGRRLKAIRNWIYWQAIEKKVVNQADGVLFTCEQELMLARETFPGYSPRAELNVGYGIAPPPAKTEHMSKAFYALCPQVKGRPYLLFLSRLHEKKGADLLVSAYLSLKQEGIELPMLVLAGPGLESSYGQRLLAQAAGEKNILFPGMLSGDAKWGAFYGCEAFILPSHQENFGIAVVEALACSKLVLISDQVNIWREIKNSGGGIICHDTRESIEGMLKRRQALTAKQKIEMQIQAHYCYQKYFMINTVACNMLHAITI